MIIMLSQPQLCLARALAELGKNFMTLFLFLTVFLNNQRNEDNSDFYGNEIASVAII